MNSETIIDPIDGLVSLLKTYNLAMIRLLIETNAIEINIITDTIKKYYSRNGFTTIDFFVGDLINILSDIMDSSLAQIFLVRIIDSFYFDDDNKQYYTQSIYKLINLGGTLSDPKINLFLLPDEIFFEYVNQNDVIVNTETELMCSRLASIDIIKWMITKSVVTDLDIILEIITSICSRYSNDNSSDFDKIALFYMEFLHNNSDYLNCAMICICDICTPTFTNNLFPIEYIMNDVVSLIIIIQIRNIDILRNRMSQLLIEYSNIDLELYCENNSKMKIIYNKIANGINWHIYNINTYHKLVKLSTELLDMLELK